MERREMKIRKKVSPRSKGVGESRDARRAGGDIEMEAEQTLSPFLQLYFFGQQDRS
jgi:hypothetical protein